MEQASNHWLIAGTLCGALFVAACGDEATATDPNANDVRTEVTFSQANFFPAGIAIDGGGNLYVGSLGTGEVVRVAPGSTTPTTLVPPVTTPGRGRAGLLVRDNVLWACDVSLPAILMMQPTPSDMIGFDVSTGAELVRHPLPGTAPLCNDLTFDSAGNMYISDSSGHQILTITAGSLMIPNRIVPWSIDETYAARLMPSPPALPLTLNGIAFSNGAIFTNNVNNGEFYRIPINADGSPGAVQVVGTGFAGADGMRLMADGSFMLVQNNATPSLTRIVFDGAAATGTPVFSFTGVQAPASVEVLDGAAWVTESQLPRFLGLDTTPAAPFRIIRILQAQLLATGTATFGLRPAQ